MHLVKIYQNLVVNSDVNAPKSIHLTEFPIYDAKIENELLIREIDTVIKVVSLGRSARNKANLKIRQPLGILAISCNNELKELINKNEGQILEELNIKKLEFVNSNEALVSYNVKPNFAIIGKKLGKKMWYSCSICIKNEKQQNQD